VVGQDRAKKVLSVAVYNHYQRVQEVVRREEEETEAAIKRQRREALEHHPLDGIVLIHIYDVGQLLIYYMWQMISRLLRKLQLPLKFPNPA
jgi:hypothetical protein